MTFSFGKPAKPRPARGSQTRLILALCLAASTTFSIGCSTSLFQPAAPAPPAVEAWIQPILFSDETKQWLRDQPELPLYVLTDLEQVARHNEKYFRFADPQPSR